jgi:hypothetical protein
MNFAHDAHLQFYTHTMRLEKAIVIRYSLENIAVRREKTPSNLIIIYMHFNFLNDSFYIVCVVACIRDNSHAVILFFQEKLSKWRFVYDLMKLNTNYRSGIFAPMCYFHSHILMLLRNLKRIPRINFERETFIIKMNW